MNKNNIRIKLLKIKKKLLFKYAKGELSSLQVEQLFIEYIKLYVKLYNNNPTKVINQEKYINGNCYSFALDIKVPPVFANLYEEIEIDDFYINPGFSSPDLLYPRTKDDIINCIICDFINLDINYYETVINNPNQNGGYKIAILIGNNDSHVIRENTDGTWSEKVGYNQIYRTFDNIYESPYFDLNYELVKVFEIVKPNKVKKLYKL